MITRERIEEIVRASNKLASPPFNNMLDHELDDLCTLALECLDDREKITDINDLYKEAIEIIG